jgi:hypothetical protein
LNSSWHTGIAANCELIFLASPLFEHLRLSSVTLGNFNNMQGFIFTTRDVAPGEELRWKYSVEQAYQNVACPPSPTGIINSPNPKKRQASTAASLKLAKGAKLDITAAAAARVPHNCPHHTTCNVGKCSECPCSICVAKQVQAGTPRTRTIPSHFE